MFNVTLEVIKSAIRNAEPDTTISFYSDYRGEWAVVDTENKVYITVLDDLCKRFPDKVCETGYIASPAREYILPTEFVELAFVAGVEG